MPFAFTARTRANGITRRTTAATTTTPASARLPFKRTSRRVSRRACMRERVCVRRTRYARVCVVTCARARRRIFRTDHVLPRRQRWRRRLAVVIVVPVSAEGGKGETINGDGGDQPKYRIIYKNNITATIIITSIFLATHPTTTQ